MASIRPTRSLGSRSKEQWAEISPAGYFHFPVLDSPFQPVSASPIADAAMAISPRRVGSGSRSQWSTLAKQEASARSLPRSKSVKELDQCLREEVGEAAAVSFSSDGDEIMNTSGDEIMSASVQNERTYDHSEATAVTANVSRNTLLESRSRSESLSPEPRPRRGLFMCGAVGVHDEWKGSFQDVNDTVRQMFTSVRRFGPDEKEAVRETFKDAQCYVKEKVRFPFLRKSYTNSSSSEREPMDHNSPRRRSLDRENNVRRISDREREQMGIISPSRSSLDRETDRRRTVPRQRRGREPKEEKARTEESVDMSDDNMEPEQEMFTLPRKLM